MKKISLSIFVALLAAMVAVPASAAKITVDGLYTNDWTYADGNIEPNNLFENQKLELNLTITEGDMFKAYLPLEFTTSSKVNDKWHLGVGMDSDWYISFTSENASAWASKNDADGYEFSAVGDPMGIGNKISANSITGFSNKTGKINGLKGKNLDVDLNLLLKGDFKFGPVSLTSYVSDNTLSGLKTVTIGDKIISPDFIVNINRLTVDLPYGIDLGVTASYATKAYLEGDKKISASKEDTETQKSVLDKFSQLTLSADASYNLPIANVGGKLTIAGAMMFQRDGYPEYANEKTKMKYEKDSLGLFIGATDFKVGPVTLGLDFSLAQPNALSVTATYPTVPSKWANKWSLALDDHMYYMTDSTSRYLPNTMILNANVGSDFKIGNVGVGIKLNNKLNMALKDLRTEAEKNANKNEKFSTIVNNITTLDTTLGITDDISLKLGTIVDYRVAEPYTGIKLEDSFPVVQGSVGTEFSALKLNVDAVVRYYGNGYIETIKNENEAVPDTIINHVKPVETVLWASFNRPFELTSNISLTPTVAGAFGVRNESKKSDNSDRETGIGGLAFVGVETEISKISVDGGYLLTASKKAGENEKATIDHVAHIGAGVKLSSIFSLNAGYTFRTDLDPITEEGQKADKNKRHFVSADLTAQVSENTKLVLSYGETGLATSKTLKSFNNKGYFDSNKPWTKLIAEPAEKEMHWDKVGLSVSIGF